MSETTTATEEYEVDDRRALINAKLDEHRIKLENEYLNKSTDEEEQSFSSYGEVIKVDDESHFVLAPVLVPDKFDQQNDIVSADEIEKAAHGFMASIRKRDDDTDLQHIVPVSEDRVQLVESFIQRENGKINGVSVAKGTWLVGFSIHDPAIWDSVIDGTFSGFSIFGRGESAPV